MESTEPAVLVNFPSTVAELDEIEDRNMTQDLGMQMKPSLLAAFQLYTLGDKLCPAAARLGREGRLSVLLADPNRKSERALICPAACLSHRSSRFSRIAMFGRAISFSSGS